MKTTVFLTALTALSLLWGTAEAQAQFGRRAKQGGGWGADDAYFRLYDAKTVETIRGEVLKVEKFKPGKQMTQGIHLLLKTATETVSVHLGPSWFIENQDTLIKPKDQVSVKGSRITFEGKPAVIAAEIVKGDQLLRLRDENGIPMWAGWRRR